MNEKIKLNTDQRGFTIVYNDFLESNVLNYYEKIIFITIKRFADNQTLKAFPSLNKLHNITGISRSKIQEIISSLKEKGVLEIEKRDNKKKGHQSNLYTLYDFAEMWKVEKEEKAKELANVPSQEHKQASSKKSIINNKTDLKKSQDTLQKSQVNKIMAEEPPESDLEKLINQINKPQQEVNQKEDNIENQKVQHQEDLKSNSIEDLDDLIDAVRLFIKEPLKTKEIKTLLSVANNDVNLIKAKYNIAKQQLHINNLTAWLISAIKNDYAEPVEAKSDKPIITQKVNRFVNYEQDNWDFDELEKLERERIKRELEK